MFRRFAAASMVASLAIAAASVVLLATPGLDPQRFYPLAFIWCVLPLVWGVWAMLAPQAWVPERFPLWGGILGFAGGIGGAFILNLPARILGVNLSLVARGAAFVVFVLVYYLLWHLVRLAWLALSESAGH